MNSLWVVDTIINLFSLSVLLPQTVNVASFTDTKNEPHPLAPSTIIGRNEPLAPINEEKDGPHPVLHFAYVDEDETHSLASIPILEEEPPSQPSFTLENFTLHKLLGQGQFGKVSY